MAKKRRLRAKNRFGVVVPIDLAAEDVTLNDGRNVQNAINNIEENGGGTQVIDNLDTNDRTKPLSAKQGKILKANIETLNDNINALLSALANMAFTSLPKPTMGELDWGGDKCAVTINNSLTGCSADKSGLQQVNEGTNLVITITADSGKLIRSVTSSQGTVVVAANKATATITINNVMSDLTINIVAEATAKGSFSASISDNRVSGTGASTGITEGSAWESVLSLNNTAEEGAAITAVEVLMAGGGSISYNSATGKVSTAFVTGNITINVTVAVVGRVTISFPLKSTGVVISSNNTVINDGVSQISVVEDSAIDLLIAPDTSYALQSVSVMMGQQAITPTDNGDGTYTVAIANVTANVTITASASQPPMLNVNNKWCKVYKVDNGVETEVTAQQELTLGQELTLIVKSVKRIISNVDTDDFVIAKDGYGDLYSYRSSGGTNGQIDESGNILKDANNNIIADPVPVHTQNDDVLADIKVNGVSNPSGIVTFYKTASGDNAANTAKIYIASVSESITIDATARLRINANDDPNGNHYYYEYARKCCTISSGVPIPTSGIINWGHQLNRIAATNSDSSLKTRKADNPTGTWGSWGSHSGGTNVRNITNPYVTQSSSDTYDMVRGAFALLPIFDDTNFDDTKKPYLDFTANGVVEHIITPEDFKKAYYTKW